MNKNDIIDEINKVFVKDFEINKRKLKPKMKIFDDLGLDSLDVVDLIVALQEKFNIRIRDDERIKNIKTLGDVYNFVEIIGKEEGFLEN